MKPDKYGNPPLQVRVPKYVIDAIRTAAAARRTTQGVIVEEAIRTAGLLPDHVEVANETPAA